MKLALTALLLVAFASAPFAQIPPQTMMVTDLERMKLRGKVKSIETFEEIQGEAETSRRLRLDTVRNFNRQGWIIEIFGYEAGVKVSSAKYLQNRHGVPIFYETVPSSDRTYSYVRDKKGRIVEQVQTIQWGERTRVRERLVLEYDDRDNVLKRTRYEPIASGSNDDPQGIDTFTYDAENRIVSAETINSHGTVTYKATRAFRPDGTLEKSFFRFEDQKTVNTDFYDQRGRHLRTEAYGGHFSVTSYDDERLESIVRFYEGSDLITTITSKFDRNGNILGRRFEFSDLLKQKMAESLPKSNSNGFHPLLGPMGMELLLEGLEDEINTYEYDVSGNWIKRVEFDSNELITGNDVSKVARTPRRIQIRKITYFE